VTQQDQDRIPGPNEGKQEAAPFHAHAEKAAKEAASKAAAQRTEAERAAAETEQASAERPCYVHAVEKI
jgi:hypothetical protein